MANQVSCELAEVRGLSGQLQPVLTGVQVDCQPRADSVQNMNGNRKEGTNEE